MEAWRLIQRRNYRLVAEVQKHLGIDDPCEPSFACNVPLRLVDKMEHGNELDPLYLQFVPTSKESLETPGYVADPTEENRFAITPRLISKYHGRVLLIPTAACAMHCRYCFRQNFPYGKSLENELEWIKSQELDEVILSGGDPLSLGDEALGSILDELSHLQLIRFHTRFPIGIPERITDSFCKLIEKGPQKIFVIHVNHPRELDDDVLAALKKLPCPVLVQSVLLAGVNDSVEILRELYMLLVTNGIIPYYLHQLDPVQGAAHFHVPPKKGLEIIDSLRATLPGYALPRYVEERPGQKSKSPIDRGWGEN